MTDITKIEFIKKQSEFITEIIEIINVQNNDYGNAMTESDLEGVLGAIFIKNFNQ